MEPVSAIGLSASLIGCIKIITTSINSLLALKTKYRQADLTVQLFLGQLSTLRAALNQICDWITFSLVGVPRHEQLVSDLTISIEGCQVLLLILSDRIASFDRNGVDRDETEFLSVRGKTRLLWAESESNQYISLLNNQISALNLLLTALQCRSIHDQNTLLQDDESRHIMHLVKDDTSSLLWLRDKDSCLSRQSTVSEGSNMLDVSFEFDREVFNSKAYQVAIRAALSRKRDKMPQRQRPPSNDSIVVVGYERSNEAEDDAQRVRSKPVNPWSSNDVIDFVGYECPSENEDDAQTIQGKSVGLWSLNDAVSNETIKRSSQADDTHPQSLPSPVARQCLRTSLVPLESAHTTLNDNRKCSKVLILGSSGAGKSTLLKSMTIYCEGTFSRVEREIFKEAIYSNLIEDMRKILDIMKTLDIELDSKDNHDHFQTVMRATDLKPDELSGDVALAIKALWEDSGVQACFRRSNKYRLNDSCGYYFDNIDRIASSNYIATNQDILRLRVRTTGITKQKFVVNEFAYSIYDVGGLGTERNKWVLCFENTDAIIFLVDISAYDRFLYEDDEVNMMQEDLTLFYFICNSRWFLKTNMILFFNRIDSLQRKLATRPIKNYFPDFDGDILSLEAVKAYIATRFVSLDDRPEKTIQICFNDMTDDTSLGKSAFAALERSMKLKEG